MAVYGHFYGELNNFTFFSLALHTAMPRNHPTFRHLATKFSSQWMTITAVN